MDPLRVLVLGPLDVRRGGRPTTPSGRRSRAILAALAARAGTPFPVDALIDEVWPEGPPTSARNSIQSHLSRLRAVVGPDRIVRLHDAYELRVDDDELDALAFGADCARARAQVARRQWDEALAAYDAALARWRGDAFDGFEDVPSARDWAAELAEQRMITVEERIDVQLERGRHADVVADLESLIANHPWRERLWRQQALALYRTDRRAEALRVLAMFQRRLLEETGLEASTALRRLEQALLRQDDGLRAPAPSPITRAVVPGSLPADLRRLDQLPLVGRGSEIDRIAAAWHRAAAGAAACVLFGGEAGVGKTRLAAAGAAHVAAAGGAVHFGRCAERLDLAYQPFAQALRDLDVGVGDEHETDERDRSLRRILPDLFQRPDRPVDVPSDVASGRFALHEAVVEVLARLARPGGLLLVLDDLHWASSPTLRLLEHLLSVARPAGVLVLGTYRDTDIDATSDLPALIEDLERRGDAEVTILPALDIDQVRELLAAQHLEVTGGQAGEVWRTTGGNPLLINELVHDARSTGGSTVLDPPSDTAHRGAEVPQKVAAIVNRRLHRLGAAREVLEWAALLGTEFESRVLEAVVADGEAGEPVLDALEDAASAGLVRELATGWWQFRHGLTRDALLAGMGETRRTRRHGTIAAALESVYDGADSQLGRVAHHYCAAAEPGRTRRAAETSLAAARLRLQQLAAEEALVHAHEGLNALARDPTPWHEAVADLHLAIADAHQQRFAEAERVEAAELAAEAARRAGSAQRLARAAVARSAFWTQGQLDEGSVRLIDESLRALGDGEPALRAELLAQLAGTLAVSAMPDGDLAGRRPVELAEEAVALAPPGSSVSTIARSSLIVALWEGPHAARQVALADEIEREATPESRIVAARWRAAPRLMLGDRQGFEADVELLVGEGARLRWRQMHAYGVQCQALGALMEGRFDDAAAAGAHAVEIAEGHPNFARIFQSQLFWLAVERDGLAELEPFLHAAVDENPRLPVFRAMLGLSLGHLGRHDEAVALLDTYSHEDFATVPRDVLWLATIGGSAELVALVDSPHHAEMLQPLLERYRGLLLVIAGGAFAYGAVDRFRAMLAAVVGDADLAREAFADAIELESQIGAAPLEARSRWWRARLLGDPDGTDAEAVARIAGERGLPALARLCTLLGA